MFNVDGFVLFFFPTKQTASPPPPDSLHHLWNMLRPSNTHVGRICSDDYTCCHTETEAANQACYFPKSQYTDTGPTSPSPDPIRPGACCMNGRTDNGRTGGRTRLTTKIRVSLTWINTRARWGYPATHLAFFCVPSIKWIPFFFFCVPSIKWILLFLRLRSQHKMDSSFSSSAFPALSGFFFFFCVPSIKWILLFLFCVPSIKWIIFSSSCHTHMLTHMRHPFMLGCSTQVSRLL